MNAVPRQIDVVVMGGGPAGSATAFLLGKAGLSTMILNPPRKYSPLGETLPAAAAPILRHLGVWNSFCELETPRLDGIASAWGGGRLECRDLFSTPGGAGWILDRQPFDKMLLHHCIQVSTLVVPQAATHIERLARRGGWQIGFYEAGSQRTVCCRYLVNAAGKQGSARIPVQNSRMTLDCLIGAVAHFENSAGHPYSLVETVDDGWFYSSLFPKGPTAVVYFTDADIYATRRKTNSRYFASQLKKAVHTSARIGHAEMLVPPSLVSAVTSRMHEAAGRDWISVGDATCSFDPMSSLGIFKAIDSPTRACESIIDALRGRVNLFAYQSWSHQVFEAYLGTRKRLYGQERRWSSTFWQRRIA
jgi:2-polyprenyl-6-methoxyphenol hydroxylase-like FAD-dependent oxidoreductase